MLVNRTWTVSLMTMAISLLLLTQFVQVANSAPPEIDVYVGPDGLVAVGDPIRVNVSVYPSPIVSVTANGISLPKISSYYWSGTLTASAPFGFHPVLVEVRDIYGNVVQDSSMGYTTAQVVALKTSALRDPVSKLARDKFLYVVCGKIKFIGGDATVDDGSGFPVMVVEAWVYSGIRDGDYVRVRGMRWEGPEPGHPYIEPQTVDKLN